MTSTPGPRPIAEAAALWRTRRAMLLLAEHEGSFRRTARRHSRSREDSEDAFQRAVEILLTKAPPARPDGLVGWMHVVTRREALAVARRRPGSSAGPKPAPAELPSGDPELVPSTTPGPQAQLEQRERLADAAASLAALKPQERRALALQGAGCSYAEIQAITGWTYTKVNRCMAEGRAALRDLEAASEAG